ncbi:hypothetical protein MHAS_04390 [Mycolicibacterium hassiacum DSM 44199]|jgi:hypothetical protein|uniref:hypothetical protein n=1 Tax=Mycolicibacterium hassiacum TaxID=46351 RepID=UPI000366805E|nr:hypothetical protein [Mycolicibacterium hassiacum]MBX5488298.1 hypothetical protein [Mycolicibacterium hassiacum]MDA4085474.1 hypothetical protein [Mycolicibacterium hassiacum DSM 44199]VCT92660.1 hypothetical protein MHAS_04390 [Mycolicibacterium hassiacum DSM 44199]
MTRGAVPAGQLLADHSVWLAVPAFAPAIVVAAVIVAVAVRNRRAAPPDDESTGTPEDGAS